MKQGWFVVLLLMLTALSCRLESDVIKERDQQAQQTYDALTTRASTPTPKGQVKCGLWGCSTVTPVPPTKAPTPGPTATSYVVLRTVVVKPHSGDWAPYFASADDAATYKPDSFEKPLGQAANGLGLMVIEEIHAGRFLKVLLSGTMELRDLGLENQELPADVFKISGETRCVEHKWRHADNASVCHGHFWSLIDGRWEVVATIPGSDLEGFSSTSESLTYVILSHQVENMAVDDRQVFRVQVMILEPVWFRCQDIATGCP